MELFDSCDNELHFVPPEGVENGRRESTHDGCIQGMENKDTALGSLEDSQQLAVQDDCDTGGWKELPTPRLYDCVPGPEGELDVPLAPIISGVQKMVASIDKRLRRESADAPPIPYDCIPGPGVELETLYVPRIPGAQKKKIASIGKRLRKESVNTPPSPYDYVVRPGPKPVQSRAPKVHGIHRDTIIAIYRRLKSENEDEKICDIAFRVEQEIKAYHPYDPLARFICREFNWNGNYVTYVYNHHAEWDE